MRPTAAATKGAAVIGQRLHYYGLRVVAGALNTIVARPGMSVNCRTARQEGPKEPQPSLSNRRTASSGSRSANEYSQTCVTRLGGGRVYCREGTIRRGQNVAAARSPTSIPIRAW